MCASRSAPSGLVPVVDGAQRPDLARWLQSARVQRLVAGRIDALLLVRVKSYRGRARVRPGAPLEREVRLNVAFDSPREELIVVLCHELAHHEAGVKLQHAPGWREVYARLIRRAREIGLLTEDQAEHAEDRALHGGPNAGPDWRRDRVERERAKRDSDEAALAPLLAAGMQVGSSVAFTYRGKRVVAEVTRINRRTISALSSDGKMRYRFSFSLVEAVR